MPTTMVFDNGTLSDAVARASRIAPTKGAAADKAAGLLIYAYPTMRSAIIMSTDLDVFFQANIAANEGEGDDVIWRVPSGLLNDLMVSLPKGEQHTITFIDRGDGKIRYKSGRVIAAFNMLEPSEYPKFEPFTDKELSAAQALAARVEQVSWACDPKSQILSGVHIDGTRLIGANQYSAAVTPCAAPVTQPVTVPLNVLAPLLKSGSDVRIAADETKFYLQLDEETTAFTNIIQGNYPKFEPGGGILRTNFLGSMDVHRQGFLDSLNLLTALIKNERLPTVTLEINTNGLVKMLTFDMEVPGIGRMQNTMDITTDFEHPEPWRVSMVPGMIQKAVEHAKGDVITIHFGVEGDPDKRHSIRVEDKSGYFCYVMPKEA